MADDVQAEGNASTFACEQCGADIAYHVGSQGLQCPYCGTKQQIPEMPDAVGEQDFRAVLAAGASASGTYEVSSVKCVSCGAESTLAPNVTHDSCAFCGVAIEAEAEAHSMIEPQSLLPFAVDRDDARGRFRQWLRSRWFAPNALKRMSNLDTGLQGVFLPHWTYDSHCFTRYVGQRGEYYWVTEYYTTTDQDGKTVRKSRQVRKTRWYPAAGMVRNLFDDLLVPASTSLPAKHVAELEPWGLENLVALDRSYQAGFKTECYAIGLEDGFELAKRQMVSPIEHTIRTDIGGDTQRIHNYSTSYQDITFKHILLPVWISSYHYAKKLYRIVINARTGEVQGERPWSAWKITGAVLGGLALAALIAWVVQQSQ